MHSSSDLIFNYFYCSLKIINTKILMRVRSSNPFIAEGKKVDKKLEILANLKQSIETWNVEMAKQSAQQALDAGIDPAVAVEKGLGLGMQKISQLFDEAKIYLPQVLAASTAMAPAGPSSAETRPASSGPATPAADCAA